MSYDKKYVFLELSKTYIVSRVGYDNTFYYIGQLKFRGQFFCLIIYIVSINPIISIIPIISISKSTVYITNTYVVNTYYLRRGYKIIYTYFTHKVDKDIL